MSRKKKKPDIPSPDELSSIEQLLAHIHAGDVKQADDLFAKLKRQRKQAEPFVHEMWSGVRWNDWLWLMNLVDFLELDGSIECKLATAARDKLVGLQPRD